MAYELSAIELAHGERIPFLPVPIDPWQKSKFVLYDERAKTTAYVLQCDGCGKHVTVSRREYDVNDSTLCMACAAKGI